MPAAQGALTTCCNKISLNTWTEMVRRKKRTIELEFRVLKRLMNHTLWEAFNKWHWNHYATLKGLMTFQS